MNERQSEIVLSTGKKVVIDLYNITIGEYREFWLVKTSAKRESEILAKVAEGIEVDDVKDLLYGDYADIVEAIQNTALGKSVKRNKEKKASAAKS